MSSNILIDNIIAIADSMKEERNIPPRSVQRA